MDGKWYSGQYVDILKKNVYVLDGFINDIQSDHLCQIITQLSNSSEPSTGWTSDTGAVVSSKLENVAIWDDVQDRITKIMSAIFGKRLVIHCSPYSRIYETGSAKSLHADGEGSTEFGLPIVMDGYSKDYDKCSMLVEYASNLYLNDSFSGGELHFPLLDLVIEPKKNQLIVFPSGIEFSHEVKTITSGRRCMVSTFYTTDKLVALHRLT